MIKHAQTARAATLLLAGCALAALAHPAAAQTRWDGSDSDDYSDADNWSANAVPEATTAVVIDSTVNAPIIGAGQVGRGRSIFVGEAGTGRLTIRDGGDLVLSNPGNGGQLNIGGSQTTNSTGGNGRVTVTGAGSTISSPGGLTLQVALRANSTGLLEILDGAVVTSNSGQIALSAGSTGTVTVSGAGSRWDIVSGAGSTIIGDLNFANATGTLNVLDGGVVTHPGGVGWTLGEASSINVSGAGSSLTAPTAIQSRGAINISNGGMASFASVQGQFGASLSVSGANSSFTTGNLALAHGTNASGGALLVEGGGQLTSAGFGLASNGVPASLDVTVQGAGSRWTITQANAQILGAGTNEVDFRVLAGGLVDSTASINNWSIGQGTSVLVSGAGSRLLSGGVLNINATTVGTASGTFVVELGGEVTVNVNSLSALGSLGGPVSRNLTVRSGGQVNFTGGSGAGLSVRNGTLLVDGGTLTGRLELAGEAARRTTVTVQGGGLIDGTGGGNWFANAGADFLVTGANSRLIAVGAMALGGDISVTAGGSARWEGMDLGSASRANSLTISGPASQLTTGDFFVARFNDFETDLLVENGGTLVTGRVLVASNSNNAVANLTVTGAGSLWQVSAGATALDLGAGAADVNLSILNGGRFESLSAINPSFRPNTDLLVSGAGSSFDTAGNISFGGGSLGDPAGTLVITNGATLRTRGPSDNGLGFNGQLRTMAITNGGSWIMTGGPNSGLQIETTDLLVDGGTLSAEGIVTIGQRFAGTTLTLLDSDFTARQLNVGTVTSNVVNIGGTRISTAGAAGLFNVGFIGLNNGNVLVLNHTEHDYDIAAQIAGGAGNSGPPRIEHLAGDTIFSGPNGGFGGVLAITGGSVRVNGSLGGNGMVTEVSGAATLGGSGTLGGLVTIADGTLAAGNSAGTLTLGGNLVLGAASVLDFEVGAPDLAPGVGSDLINVAGNLTLDGTLNLTDLGGFGAGLYRLINYGGTLTDNGLEFGTVPTGFAATGLTLDTATGGQVNLLAQAPTPPTPVFDFIFWDGSQTTANGLIDGGSGTWTAARTNWTTLAADNNGVFDAADFLIFRAPEQQQSANARTTAAFTPSAATGTVTVDNTAGQVSLANGVQFAATGYTVSGGAIRLDSPGVAVRVGDGSSTGAAFVATIASALTGAGSLTLSDLGVLILGGANTYSGGTRVLSGTLQGNSTSLQGVIDVAAAGTLLFDQSADGSFTGVLSGSGALAKEGAGVLTLTGNSSGYIGRAELTQGGLNITGSLGQDLGNSLLATAAGTMLTGNGTLGNLELGGIVSPGAGAATLAVDGDVTFLAGSTYRVDLAANGASDLIAAGDDVLINGGTVAVNLLDPDLSYGDGDTFVIVRADESLTGTFDALVETSAFLDFALGYTADTAFLRLALIRQFPDVALTFNQRQASLALMELDQATGSDSLAVYNALLLLDADSARAAFDATSGEIYGDLPSAGRHAASNRTASRLLGAFERGREGWDAWLAGGLSTANIDGDGNGAGLSHDGRQVELGLDYHGPGNGWMVSASGGWTSGDVTNDGRGSAADLDGWFASGLLRYGTYGPGITLALAASHARTSGDVVRAIGVGTLQRSATAAIDNEETGLAADLRYGFGHGAWTFGPVVGIESASGSLDGYAESGAGALSLAGAGGEDRSTRFGGGAFAAFAGQGVSGLLDLRYVTADGDDAAIVHRLAGSPRAFEVHPAYAGGDAVRVSGALDAGIGAHGSIGLRATALLGGEEQAVTGQVSVRFGF